MGTGTGLIVPANCYEEGAGTGGTAGTAQKDQCVFEQESIIIYHDSSRKDKDIDDVDTHTNTNTSTTSSTSSKPLTDSDFTGTEPEPVEPEADLAQRVGGSA